MLGRHGTVIDCQEVDPGIAMGPLAPICQDLPLPTNALLNLCAEAQPVFSPQAQLEPWQGGHFAAYARMPIMDGPFPGLEWLQVAVNQVLSWRSSDWNVIICCAAGISRSGMVAAAVLMTLHSWTLDQALAHIRLKRPQVQPNPNFMAGLLEYQAAVLRPAVASKFPEEPPGGTLNVLDGGINDEPTKEAH